MLKTPIGRFRLVGMLEGISLLLLLCVAMPVKYMMGEPILVRYIGMVHGLLFVMYCLQTISIRSMYNWSLGTTAKLLISTVVPFGTFYMDSKLLKKMPEKN